MEFLAEVKPATFSTVASILYKPQTTLFKQILCQQRLTVLICLSFSLLMKLSQLIIVSVSSKLVS